MKVDEELYYLLENILGESQMIKDYSQIQIHLMQLKKSLTFKGLLGNFHA